MRKLIHPDGTEIEYENPIPVEKIDLLLGDGALDNFRLRDKENHVVLVNDLGHHLGLPLNQKATDMYWEACGGQNDHTIVGSVFVCPDSDFGG